jgi:hypothetical protein
MFRIPLDVSYSPIYAGASKTYPLSLANLIVAIDEFGGRTPFMNNILEAPPKIFRKAVVLRDLCQTTNSYVRGPRGTNRGKRFEDIVGRVKMARDSGATEEEIRNVILRGTTDPPKAIPERVEKVRRHFLN